MQDESAERCAPTGAGDSRVWGLVRTTTPGGDVTLVGTTSAFRNDTIATAGNAALALGLLGGDERLVWYTPTVGTPDAAPTLGELAPPWVPSALALLALVAVAAGVWRGRRLGPLVVERLPVVVRAAETTEGRARMYARTRDRTHALDTLRVAAVRRIARLLGLPAPPTSTRSSAPLRRRPASRTPVSAPCSSAGPPTTTARSSTAPRRSTTSNAPSAG
ncbi:hypothetical protein Q9Q99_05735 [Curtobacterium flaccumfaciens]|nr:hypothetical protein Q9Q99_05735 [Curtobacterium flaccumfaciens]